MIPLFRPSLNTEEILDELRPVLDSGWVGLGPQVALFEKELGKYLGASHDVVGLNSCTSALHLAYLQGGRGWLGNRVATTPLTFVSTNHAMLHCHCMPVFVDINPETGCMDVDALKRTYDIERFSGVSVVHYGGYADRFEQIEEFCKERKLRLIEDCAHALGGKYADNKRIGSKATSTACFSFHAVKNLPMGDGGAILSNDSAKMRMMRWLGIDKSTAERVKGQQYSWEYNVQHVGYKYHMNDISATIGLVMLRHLEKHNARRRQIATAYQQAFAKGGKTRSVCPTYDVNHSACHIFPVLFANRNRVMAALQDNDIGFGMHYRLSTRYPMYEKVSCPNAERWEKQELTLPIFVGMTDAEVERVIKVATKASIR